VRDFKNLTTFQEIQINHIIDEHKNRQQRLKPIEEQLSDYYKVLEIWEVNDFQIAKIKRRAGDSKEILYSTFHNYKSLHEMASNFDQALLICLSHKYEGYNSQFPLYAAKMLNAKFEPEFE
jgi:hypothetical protein